MRPKIDYKLISQFFLRVALLFGIVFSLITIVRSAAQNPGHAWADLDDAAIPIANGGTGQTAANDAFNALVPSQTGNSGKFLTTDASNTSWGTPSATTTSIVLTARSAQSLTFDVYCHPTGSSVCADSDATLGTLIPFDVTIQNLNATMQTAPAAGGNTCAFTVMKATACTGSFSATALTCTVTGDGSTKTCSDTSNKVGIAAGTCLQVFYDVTNTCSGFVSWSFEARY